MTITDLCSQFNVEPISIEELCQGLINVSYVVTDKNNKRYLLQEINSRVFTDIDAVMKNIEKTTRHITIKAYQLGRDTDRSSLQLLPTKTGNSYITVFDDTSTSY